MASGDLSRWYVSKSFESAIDTVATLNLSFLGTFTFNPKNKEQIDKNVNGTPYEQSIVRTGLMGELTISGDATCNLVEPMFKDVMQARPTTTGAGDPYSHTHTDEASGSPATGGMGTAGATVTAGAQVAGIANYIDRIAGVTATQLTLSGTGEGIVQVSTSFETSGTVAATTEPSVTLPTEGYLMGNKTTLSVGGSDVSTRIVDYSVTFNNGFNYVPRAGSTTGSGVSIDRENKRPFIEFTYTLVEGAVNEAGGHDDWPAKTQRAIILVLKGDTNRDVTITLKNCQIQDGYPIKTNESGVYKVQRKVRALYNSGTTPKWYSVVVRNDVAAYT